jgi:LPS export ABC transporter permease LptF/LPS export ABC transporter permease LptG
MGVLARAIFFEIVSSAVLGTVLFTFVLFLQRAGRSFELLVRSSATPETIAMLFGLILPFALTFTLPVGTLVGILICLSRMSSDGEIIGLRAAGVPSRKVIGPVATFATLAMAVTATCSLWVTPWSFRETTRLLNRLSTEQLTAEIQPRVFQEQFPNTILYVADVVPGPIERWRGVFLADLRPAEQRSGTSSDQAGEGPRLTLAREAIALPDVKNNRIQLHMLDGSTNETGKDRSEYFSTNFPLGDQVLQASRPNEVRAARPYSEMYMGPLYREARQSREAAIELHQRLARPFACILLALVGIPLGISSRKSGKSGAFVVSVFLAFVYYIGFVSLINLGRQGTLPVWLAVWAPNVVFAIAGAMLLVRLETPGDRDVVAGLKTRYLALWAKFRGLTPSGPKSNGRTTGTRLPLLPQILDTYILSTFLFYFTLLLASFVMMTHVYTFFELLGDIVRNQIPLMRVFTYLFFLTPKLVYDSSPVSVLVAVLVTFGVMSKNNEVTAFKATGVSLHRLAVPVLIASAVFSAGLFAFDYYRILPEANRRQDAIRAEIKGRAPQTYLRPDRKWIYGQGPRIYYYKYFDPGSAIMVGVNVYELDVKSFRLTRHISAEQAHWEPALKAWIFENGWSRQMSGAPDQRFVPFQAATFPELEEPPSYFLKEVIEDKQMNYPQLAAYIAELRQSGFDTVHLRVQLQKKFSVPMFAFIMAVIAVPFAFLTGNRGAMAGVGVSLGIAVAYWAVGQLFEQFGNVNELPAALAAWSPDALFSLAGVYLMARMKT